MLERRHIIVISILIFLIVFNAYDLFCQISELHFRGLDFKIKKAHLEGNIHDDSTEITIFYAIQNLTKGQMKYGTAPLYLFSKIPKNMNSEEYLNKMTVSYDKSFKSLMSFYIIC